MKYCICVNWYYGLKCNQLSCTSLKSEYCEYDKMTI